MRPDAVRLAMPAEAAQITAVQRAWLGVQPGLADLLDDVDEPAMTQAWNDAIVAPPLATYRVLVAIDGSGTLRGFAAIGPSDDDDAEPTDALVGQFCIQPGFETDGHNDRLLHAIADTLRADGFTRATWWLRSTDDALRAWLSETGWAADGAHQEVGDEHGHVLKQIRLHTALV